MELAGAAINAAVVAVVGVILAWLAKGRFDAVDHRIDRLEERLYGRIDRLEASVDALRSDITQIALAVGVRQKTQNG